MSLRISVNPGTQIYNTYFPSRTHKTLYDLCKKVIKAMSGLQISSEAFLRAHDDHSIWLSDPVTGGDVIRALCCSKTDQTHDARAKNASNSSTAAVFTHECDCGSIATPLENHPGLFGQHRIRTVRLSFQWGSFSHVPVEPKSTKHTFVIPEPKCLLLRQVHICSSWNATAVFSWPQQVSL